VRPLYLEQHGDRDAVLKSAEDLLVATGTVSAGDMIVLTVGEPLGKSGGTNTMKLVRVGDDRP
jgi:pyruvate kinase